MLDMIQAFDFVFSSYHDSYRLVNNSWEVLIAKSQDVGIWTVWIDIE